MRFIDNAVGVYLFAHPVAITSLSSLAILFASFTQHVWIFEAKYLSKLRNYR